MIFYPKAGETTPLVVAGPQRCGTRFVTNVLNSVSGVTIQDEISGSIMDSVVKVVKECNRQYARLDRTNRRERWDLTKRDFMFSVWGNLNKNRRTEASEDCLYYGYKSPYHEKYFDFYNALFDPIRPVFVCCIRSFMDHYFSVNARWPKRTIHFVSQRYVRSLRQIRYMKRKRPDCVRLFVLDHYKVAGIPYLREFIFEPLGLKKITAAEFTAGQGPANASTQLGLRKRNRLAPLQAYYLRLYPQPFREFDALCREFGQP